MGLDQYAYVAGRPGQYYDHWEDGDFVDDEWVNPRVTKPEDLMYWRKHSSLQGWMRNLWEEKGNSGSFNGDEVELTGEDLDRLEQDVLAGNLPETQGFCFGNGADNHYKEQDLKFIKEARKHLFFKFRVFYNSSW